MLTRTAEASPQYHDPLVSNTVNGPGLACGCREVVLGMYKSRRNAELQSTLSFRTLLYNLSQLTTIAQYVRVRYYRGVEGNRGKLASCRVPVTFA